MKHLLWLFFLATALNTVATAETAKKEDQIIMVKSDDAEMNAAIEKAQKTLDTFLETYKKPQQNETDFVLKVKISDDNGSEHFWVTPFRETDTGFVGTISNTPEIVESVEYGQEYTFKRSDISDWGYLKDGKRIGSFTVCVTFKHMDKAEVEMYKRDYGYVCE